MYNEEYYYERTDQSHFALITFAFVLLGKMLFRAVIYSPLICTGFLIALRLIDPHASVLIWITVILTIAWAIYLLLFFIKGIIIGLKNRSNILWIPLFLVCVGYACVLPSWFVFEPLQKLVYHYNGNHFVAVLLDIAFGIGIYLKYQFLTPTAPHIAFPFLRAGFILTGNTPFN